MVMENLVSQMIVASGCKLYFYFNSGGFRLACTAGLR